MNIKIVIVDNHPIVQSGLAQILDTTPGMHVVGCAACTASGCATIEKEQPDLVIFDTSLADMSGLETLRRFRSRFPHHRAIVFTSSADRELVVEALKQRINGFVAKTSPVERLIQAIRTVASGHPYLDSEISPALVAEFTGRSGGALPNTELSVRQKAVLRLLAEGLSNKEIARDLYITESTVKFHVSAILQTLHARNRAHAVRIAENEGWIRQVAGGWNTGRAQFAQ